MDVGANDHDALQRPFMIGKIAGAVSLMLPGLASSSKPKSGLCGLQLPHERETVLESEHSESYTIGRQIGHGSFGVVYACSSFSATHTRDERAEQLCIKVTPIRDRKGSRVTPLFVAEQREIVAMLAELRHANVVIHRDFIETAAALHVVMERCEGPDLAMHRESAGELPSAEALQLLAAQILSAVAAVHTLRLMHRDIKPENFRFHDASAQTLKLLDFGCAKRTSGRPEVHSVTGTLLFAAPEVFGKEYCQACDMWSVGVVLFWLTSGLMPFESSDARILCSMHKDPILTGASLFRGKPWRLISPAARDLVRGLLTVDPQSRLTAETALEHRWFSRGIPQVASSESFTRSCNGVHVADLKRTCRAAFNLADYLADDVSDGESSAVSGGTINEAMVQLGA